jgi:hypothetical protein
MSVSRYILVHLGFAALAIVAALGLLWTWPWLAAENSRQPLWMLGLMWSAEVAAVVWFVYMWIRLAVTWDLDSAFTDRTAHERWTQVLAVLVLLVGVVDLTSTFLLQDIVAKRRDKAETGVLRVNRTKIYSIKHGRNFTAFAWCDVIDSKGKAHPVYFFGPQSRWPENVHDAILRNRLPVEFPVQYDPEFPRRYWTNRMDVGTWNGWRFWQEITACAMGLALLSLVSRNFLLFISLPIELCPMLGAAVRIMGAGFYMWVKEQTATPPW